jgi:lipopolysaccharide export system permease protein
MPWTLYRYFIKELLKYLVPSALTLLLVFSFATAIKPLSDGLLGPLGLLRFVFYTVPTMLTLVLPFAAGFAVTMVFCRAVADNEIIACLAGGLSYRTILLPVFFLGLVLTLGLFYLSNWVVPAFYQRIADVLERDVTQVIVQQLRRGQAVELQPGVILYASAVASDDVQLEDRQVQPQSRIMVRGVVIGSFGPDGSVRREATADAADVHFFRDGQRAWIEMVLKSLTVYAPTAGITSRQPGITHTGRLYFPSRFRDEPRFFSWPKLSRLGRNPDGYDRVRDRKRGLARLLAAHGVLDELSEIFARAEPGRSHLVHPGNAEAFRFEAPHAVRQGELLKLTGSEQNPVTMSITVEDLTHAVVTGTEAWIRIATIDANPLMRFGRSGVSSEPWFDIHFVRPLIQDQRAGEQPIQQEVLERRGRWPDDVCEPLLERPSAELLAMAAGNGQPSIDKSAGRLDRTIRGLKRKIIAQLNLRGASAIAAVLFLMFGALLSLRMGRSMPLVVYFWVFLAAMIVVVITHSGENMMTDLSYGIGTGLLITWTGDALLAVASGILYWKVART